MVGKGRDFRARKIRPCNNFDPDGHPIQGGCPRTANVCHFIHPEEPEWRRHKDRPDDEYRGTRRSRFNEEEKERDQGWGTRQINTALDSPVLSIRAVPVLVSATYVPQTPAQPPPLPKIDTSTGGTMVEPVLPNMDMDVTSPVSPTYHPAPTPVLGPPPNVPDAPGFEDIDILGSAPDIVMDARKKMWSERVKLLVEAVKAFKAHKDAAEERVNLEALEGRPGLSLAGPEGGETVLEAFRAALNAQALEEEALKAKVDKMVNDIVEADNGGTAESVWPMTPAQMDDEFAKQDRYNDIVRYIRDLRATALKIWESLDEDAKKGTQPPDAPVLSHMPEEAAQNPSEEALSAENEQGGRHKKRKLNDGRAAEDLTAVLFDKISTLEDSLTRLDARHQEEEQRALDAIEELIDIRLQEFQENEVEPELSMEVMSPATREQLADVGKGIADADTQVRTVAKGMEDCARRLNTLVVDYPAAVQAYNDALQRHEANQSRISNLFSEQMNSQQAINALQNAFRALIAQQQQQQHQQPSPPASPRLPSCDVMVAAVEQGLKESLREGLREAVEEFRRDVKERMETEVGALIGDVAAKVEQTVGIIMKISDKLEALPQLEQ